MKTYAKMLALGSGAILAVAVGWTALAETPAGSSAATPMQATDPCMGWHMGSSKMGRVFADPSGYLASVKQELGITDAEWPSWDAYAQAVQDATASLKSLHQSIGKEGMHDGASGQAVMAQARDQHRQAYQKLRTAAEQLVASLDEGQQQKAKETLAGLTAGNHAMMEHMGMMGNGAMR